MPINAYLIRKFIYNYKRYIFGFAILCFLTGGAILKPIDIGLDTIENNYPESREVVEMIRKGFHVINSVTDVTKEVIQTLNASQK